MCIYNCSYIFYRQFISPPLKYLINIYIFSLLFVIYWIKVIIWKKCFPFNTKKLLKNKKDRISHSFEIFYLTKLLLEEKEYFSGQFILFCDVFINMYVLIFSLSINDIFPIYRFAVFCLFNKKGFWILLLYHF